ncbi:MAG: nuclear transport factor 2 family protein [Chitinophaga sp.]|uniref:nuclear transport factor 2 family protein n=1 Tax=Chitinophaga sp. TaxID=1869181 RepID=UPI001B04DCED|nr:nuclear transport factor 2 family protein [Chitinophaga sp.]MBO9729621.1 nuclear transport factor 2 family protein [Chitinophaga sp.]
MEKKIRAMLLPLLLLFQFQLHAQNEKTTTMQQTIIQLHRNIMKAVKDKNGAPLQESLKSDFIFTSATADLWNKDKFINGFALNPSLQFPEFAPQDQQVIMNDHAAVLTALVHIKIVRGAGAAPEELWERTTETYVKEQGGWKLLALHATFLPRKQ